MPQDQETDFSQIAWPGFVDILSAVIIMFVFFLMIVATALFFHIIIFISKIESDQVAENVQSEYEYEFSQVQTEFAESLEQSVKYDEEYNRLIVFFDDDAISVLPKIKEEIMGKLKGFVDNDEDVEIKLKSSKFLSGLDAISRKISVARMLNLRNTVIASGVKPQSIKPEIINGYDIEGKEHWVIIEIQEK